MRRAEHGGREEHRHEHERLEELGVRFEGHEARRSSVPFDERS